MREATGGRGADVVLDMVGGDYTARNLDVLAVEGRLVQIAFLKTSKVTLDLAGDAAPALDHRLDAAAALGRGEGRWPGRSRPTCGRSSRAAGAPVIDTVFPLAQAAEPTG